MLLVDEVDAGHVGVERERGFLHERRQDLLQVQRAAERAGGADDGAILQRARGAALVGLEAGVAGRGLVGEQLGELDLRGRELTASVQPMNRTLRTLPRQATGTNRTEAMPWRVGAAGHDRVAGQRVRDREREAGLQDAGGAGRTVFEAHELARPAALVAGAAAVLADLEQAHVVGAQRVWKAACSAAPSGPGVVAEAASWATRASGLVTSPRMSVAVRRVYAFRGSE